MPTCVPSPCTSRKTIPFAHSATSTRSRRDAGALPSSRTQVRPAPEWGDGVRIAVHGYYLIVYRVRDEGVQILRIVHGARDLDALFESEPLPE